MGTILVHIGYHKSGSSWLQNCFFSNPATGYRWLGKREPGHPVRRFVLDRPFQFDARAVRGEFDPLLAEAESAGLVPVISLERLSGNPFSGGYDSKEIADRLAAVFPEGRVLVVIREQRDMIVSTYKQYVRRGGTSTLADFLDPRTTRSARVATFDFGFFEYHHLIRYYRERFGASAVLVRTYEQFAEDPKAFVAAIARFAGRPIDEDVLASLPYTNRENRSRSALTVSAVRRLNRLSPRSELNTAPVLESAALERLADRLWKTDSATRLARRRAARNESSLRDAVAEAVGDRYVSSNRETADLTGIDLGAYGWQV